MAKGAKLVTKRIWNWSLVLVASLAVTATSVQSQSSPDADSVVAEGAEARKSAERFLMVLERNPRKGTALDKVVEFHVDHESLDELITRQREKAEATEFEDAGRAWLVVGLIEASQGDLESAQTAFERAEELLPKSAVASFSLGQNLMALNRWPEAAAAFERAIQRKPAPTDLLDVFQTLGRVQQRLASGDQVIEVWSRLEKLVPNDPRVPELIAKTLLEDGHWEAALPRFEALAKATKDLYRRSEFELEAVDLRMRLGQFEQALAEADRLLGGLKPDHWLFRETRRRVEEAFLAKDDAAGLIKYYEARLDKQPDDLDAVVRLSRALVSQERRKDARSRLESSLKLAPSSVELRLELIELLQSDKQFAEAIAQYEQLDRITPNNPDHIRDWGFLVLKGEDDKDQAARAKSAAAIWRKLIDAKPKDAVVAAQVADLMASADKSLLGDAAELLRRAVALEPEVLSHREQLGEVLDAAGQKDESLAAWRAMAEEPRRNANNLAQLAEVLSRFGYRDETLTTIDAACELDRKSLELRFQQAELRRKWKQSEAAMAALAEAAALADSPETFDRVVQLEVKVLTESESLTDKIEALKAETQRRGDAEPAESPQQKAKQSPAHDFFRLAKYFEAASQLREACVAARKAVELAPKNGVFLQAAAKLLTQDSQWLSAIELYERLMKLDRRFRIESLRSIVELEQKLGRKDKALKAGRDLLAAGPGNPENAEFVVDVCLRFNQNVEALQILRRASRQNVADKRLALKLVERLMDAPEAKFKSQISNLKSDSSNQKSKIENQKFSLDEARDVLWRVFEQSSKTDDRIEVIRKLAELSVFPGEFAKLTQRLERLRHEPKLRRDASLALVQVHEQAGDTEQARRELERLLPQAPRDAELLKRMVSLSESTGDLDAAIAHQKRLAELTRKRETDEHLVVLLRRAGRDADADLLSMRWLETERDPAKLLREIDRLIGEAGATKKRSLQQALNLIHAALDREPQQWEFLYRHGWVLFELNRIPESWVVYDELMGLPILDGTPSLLASNMAASSSSGTRESSDRSLTTSATAHRIQQLRVRVNVESSELHDYGRARVAVLLHRMAHKRELTIPQPVGLDAKKSALRTAWDQVYLNLTGNGGSDRLRIRLDLLALAPTDAAAQWIALNALYSSRGQSAFWPFAAWKDIDKTNPLDADTLDQLLTAFRSLQTCDEAMEWDRVPIVELLCRELIRAGRSEAVHELLAEIEQTSESPEAFGWLLQQAAINDDTQAALRILTKLASLDFSRAKFPASARGTRRSDPANLAWWLSRCMIEPHRMPDEATTFGPRTFKVLDAAFDVFASGKLPLGTAKPFVTTQSAAYSAAQSRIQPRFAVASTPYELGLVWKSAEQFETVKANFPSAEALPELSALHVLRQAWSLASTPRSRAELLAHIESAIQRAEPESRLHFLWTAARACQLCWDDQPGAEEEAAKSFAALRELFDQPHASPALKFHIATWHGNHAKQADGLDLLDRIETTDGQLRKEVEQRAVQFASGLKRTERVQLAAERLFGMKLEPAEEMQLAGTLSGLGLHEYAEAIRLRLPQRAGNNLTLLQQMMQERIEAKKFDEASEIAEQIVRRTSPANTLIGSAPSAASGTFGGGQQARVITQTSQARTKALALLGQQAKLGPLIEQAEQQFDRSPQSLKLFGQLAELYGAAGTPEKQTGLLVRMADSEAPDPQFRLTLARALVSAGKAEFAVPHFLFAIEKLPNATAQVLFEVEQILSELGRTEELARIVLKSKLAVNDQQRIELFRRIVSRLQGPPIRAKLIIDLFQKAFREAPEFRPMLASQLLALGGSVWHQEELWPLARDFAVPPESLQNVGPWYGIDIVHKSAASPANLLTRNVIDLAKQIGKLDELEAHVLAAMKSHPDWTVGGNVTLGLIKLQREGQIDQAKPLFEVMFRGRNQYDKVFGANSEQMSNFHLLASGVGHELAVAGKFAAASEFYELTTPELALEECRLFGKEPAMQQLAVRIVSRMLSKLDNPDELARQAGSPLFLEAAKITAEIDQPYVSARLAQAMITRWQLPGANNSDGGTWLEQLEQRFSHSLMAIKPAMLPELSVAWTPSSARSPEGGEATASLDLLPHVTGNSLSTLRLDSPFVSLIREAAKDKVVFGKWKESLRRMAAPGRPASARGQTGTAEGGHPTDLSIVLLTALTELFATDSSADRGVLMSLIEAAKSHAKAERPRTAPPGFHPQLGLWLVARECLARDDLKSIGEQLADLATESASQHFDPRFQWAILRERGELALKSGDKELASKLWTRLAGDVLRPRSAEETVPMLLGQQFVWSSNWPSTRLHRARDLCRLTLNAEMPDLSLAIFRDTIHWPKTAPFQLKIGNDNGLTIDPDVISATVTLNANFMAKSGLAEEILSTWDTLEPEWRAKGVDSDAIFATLLECVLPANRSEEVFVFATQATEVRTPTSERSSNRNEERPDEGIRSMERDAWPTSLALRLVELAVAEKRIDTLTERLKEREKTATKPLALRLIHLLLWRKTNDERGLDAELTKLAQQDWSKPSVPDARVATQIVRLLAPLTERRESIGKVFEQWVGPLGKAFPRDEHPLSDIRRWLAKQQLDQQQPDKAKEMIASHLRHMDQVWSATGAMDGQHLRRLELLAIATEYANAGLTREAIDLLAQVADARWPDRYPDENPGEVLAILEAKLKSRSAQERYELWRAWSLPNDGVKSMRMLTGAEGRGQGAEVRDQKSEVKSQTSKTSNLKPQISTLRSSAFLLVEAAREADRLAELDAFVEEQMKQRPSDRIHVLLALIHFANNAPAVAETLVRQQITLWEPQAGKTNSATRTRVWDDWLLSEACSRHESLRELAEQLSKRAESGAKELADDRLLRLIGSRESQ
jgi:tetratricopeptide (TPR) repeat protein